MGAMRARPAFIRLVGVAFACLLLGGCGVYPVLLQPEAIPFGTLQAGGFIAAGGRDRNSDSPAPGVADFGVSGRLGLLPGVEIGARGSLFGGALADVRLQPIRKPVSVSLDMAVYRNHFLANPLDPHVTQPVTYTGVRPAVIIGVGHFYGGGAYGYTWSRGEGLGFPIYDTLRAPTIIAGVRIDRKIGLLIEAEAFMVSDRWRTVPGFCLGFAGFSPPVRLWGKSKDK